MPPHAVLTLTAALGAWLGFANPWLQFPLAVLVLPASLAALGRHSETPKQAFARAWLAGGLAALGGLYWVYWPVQHYGEVHWLLALPAPVLLALAMGAYFGLFGLAAHLAERRLAPLPGLLFLGLAWTLLELLMGNLLSGFPWLTLSVAFVPWPLVLQPAAFIGAYGLSGILALAAVAPGLARRSLACGLAGLAAAALVCGLGWLRLRSDVEDGPPHTVAVVQGNIDQSIKWDASNQAATVMGYVALSRQILSAASPELIVWPETAMPFYFQDDVPLRFPVLDFVRSSNVSLLLGSPAYAMRSGNAYTLFNRAYLLSGQATAPQWYDKEHLVPFGEYMPLPGWIPMNKLVHGVGDFAPGQDQRPLLTGQLAIGVLVCYEAIFAGLAQEQVAKGANLLVNISNDGWFGATSAPIQHLHLAALRAVEQNRWLVRSTNTGLSAFIDPLGRIRPAGAQFQAQAAAGVVHTRARLTVFHRFYNELLFGALALAAGFAALMLLRGRRAQR